ncbi:histone-lysine N-methyltransferase H3 lysine-9 specific SUVH6-like protein, partial [Trifolium pratense]
VSRKLLQEAEAKAKSNEKERRRFDLQAEKILKEKGNYVNEGDKILGSVPGVVVGDEFQYRIELNVIGFHRQIQGGQGGNVMSSDKDPKDQKLVRGNLALKNSSEEKNPVRVIRGNGVTWEAGLSVSLAKNPRSTRACLEGTENKREIREGQCVKDISYGKERIPICAVNTIDDEKPPPFKYITKMIYPDCCNLVPPEGCGCTNGYSDHANLSVGSSS